MVAIEGNDRLIAERLDTAAGASSDMSGLFAGIGEWVVEVDRQCPGWWCRKPRAEPLA